MYINLSPKTFGSSLCTMEAPTGWTWKNLLFTGEIFPKIKKFKKKIKRFWWVSITKSEGNSQNHQIPIVGFQCVAINIGGYFKNYTSYLVYSQLLLNFIKDNLPIGDHHLIGYKKT